MDQNPKANPDCTACHGTGIVVCDHGGDGRFVVAQKCECVTELPWYAINDLGAEPEAQTYLAVSCRANIRSTILKCLQVEVLSRQASFTSR